MEPEVVKNGADFDDHPQAQQFCFIVESLT